MPFKAVLPNSLPAVMNVGAGPDKNMAAPSAILSVRVGFRLYKAPPRCVRLRPRRRFFRTVRRFHRAILVLPRSWMSDVMTCGSHCSHSFITFILAKFDTYRGRLP